MDPHPFIGPGNRDIGFDQAITGERPHQNFTEPAGKIRREEWVEVARANRVPTLIDAAADVPPVENLSAFNKMGFDLVAFSGGKADE